MAQHNEFGRISEDRAAAYLMARGYTIRERNWRFDRKEVDIIAQKNGVIAFVEVKARRNDHFGDAIDAITDNKIRNLIHAANAYVTLNIVVRQAVGILEAHLRHCCTVVFRLFPLAIPKKDIYVDIILVGSLILHQVGVGLVVLAGLIDLHLVTFR